MDLYRGKDEMTGDWIIGAAVCIGDRAYILGSDSLFPERPAYYGMAIGAGLEDANITDRYEAAAYGWTEALDRYEENFPEWIRILPETVTRCTGRHDLSGNVLFEGDLLRDQKGILYEICYGRYFICQKTENVSEHTGFFRIIAGEHLTEPDYEMKKVLPLGAPENDGYLAGNIFDNPEQIRAAD